MFVRSLISLVVVAAATGVVAAQQPPAKPDTPQVYTWSFDSNSNSGYLGVQTQEVTRENFSKFGLRDVRGVAVEKVVENSPAAAAGLKDGDVIIKFNGEPVTSSGKLTRLIRDVAPDHQATVTVLRGGSEQDITVTLGKHDMPKIDMSDFHFDMPAMPSFDFKFDMPDLKDLGNMDQFKQLDRLKDLPELTDKLKNMPQLMELDKLKGHMFDFKDMPQFKELEKLKDLPELKDFNFTFPNGGDSFVWGPGSRRIGISVNELTKQHAEKYGVNDGLLINDVGNDSPALRAGLKAGDIITEINGKAVKSDIDLIREINSQKDGDVQLTIVRDGKSQTITVTPEKAKDGRFIWRSDSDGGAGFMPDFAPLVHPTAPTAPTPPTAPRAPAMTLFHRIV